MKLAFCLFKYFPFGGLQRDFVRIAKECQAQGHEIHVFTIQWQGEKLPGFHLHLLPASGLQNHTRIRRFVKQLKSILTQTKFDCVIGFNKMPGLDVYYAADVCFQARVREKHGYLYRLLPRYRQLQAYEEAVFSPAASTRILLIAAKQKAEFQHFYHTQEERFHLLPPGITKFAYTEQERAIIRSELRNEYHLQDQFLIVMVGSGFKTKGVDRAIHALASLPKTIRQKTQLFIIGQDHAGPFQSLAQKCRVQNQVVFLGGRSDVPRFLLGADLLLHPAYHENTGTVLLEALTLGLPVLTTDVCGYAQHIQEAQAGRVLNSPFQQSTLNSALADMLTSPSKLMWQHNAIRYAQQNDLYSMPQHAAKLCLQPPVRHNFDFYMALKGEVYRHQEGRMTQRVRLNDQSYFIKQHHGVGWREIFKNLLQLRLPVLGAKNEYLAIRKLQSLAVGVPNVIAYGKKGLNPAQQKSYILLEDVNPSISLEDVCQAWPQNPPRFNDKQKLLHEVARIARALHTNGVNHRDFYLCHFLLDKSLDLSQQTKPRLCLIDLHRAQIRQKTPRRWVIKDLAGLYFSSKNIGLTNRDLYRFICEYHQLPLKIIFNDRDKGLFWKQVKARGEHLYNDHTT